jgi:L-fuconolactonase
VRRLLQGERDPAFCLQPGFIRGVELLPDFGFSFDICVKHHQLPAVVELVRRCPGTRFVLDHVGKPDIAAGLLDPWRESIAALAALPNVDCKVSGMVTEADPAAWSAADLAPYVAHVLAAFGEDRVLFASDWPVVTLAATYRRWVETLDGLTAGLAEMARRKLWAENARRVYRLD